MPRIKKYLLSRRFFWSTEFIFDSGASVSTLKRNLFLCIKIKGLSNIMISGRKSKGEKVCKLTGVDYEDTKCGGRNLIFFRASSCPSH
jgi:hypothetical protein